MMLLTSKPLTRDGKKVHALAQVDETHEGSFFGRALCGTQVSLTLPISDFPIAADDACKLCASKAA